jgi:hypothetical protein
LGEDHPDTKATLLSRAVVDHMLDILNQIM